MACKGCGRSMPIVRKGLPTIYAYGPFPDYEEVEYTLEKKDGPVQEREKDD